MRTFLTLERLENRRVLALTATLLHDFTPGEASSDFSESSAGHDEYLYFKVNDNSLWRTDGTPAGTSLLSADADFRVLYDPYPVHGGLSAFNAQRYDDGGIRRNNVLVTNGTVSGTKVLIADRTLKHAPIANDDGSTYLLVQNWNPDYPVSAELWRLDQAHNAQFLFEIPDAGHRKFQSREIGEVTYLNYVEHWGGTLLRTDGTPEGTWILSDSVYSDLQQNSSGWHYLEANDSQATILRINIQTGEPETLVSLDWPTFRGKHTFRSFGETFFITREVRSQDGLIEVPCISDGTVAGTTCDLFGDVEVDGFHGIQELDGVLLLPSSDGLWRTDGTVEGTFRLSDVPFNYLGRVGDYAYIGSADAPPFQKTIVEFTDGSEVFDAVASEPEFGDGSEFLPPTPDLDTSGFGAVPGAYWTFSDDYVYRQCSWESHCGPSELWEPSEAGELQPIWSGVGRPVKIEDTWFRSDDRAYIADASGRPIVESFSVGPRERMQIHSNRTATELPLYFTTSTEDISHLWTINGKAEVQWIDSVHGTYSGTRHLYEDVFLYTRPGDDGGTELWASEVGTTRTQLIEFPTAESSPNPVVDRFVWWNGAHLVEAQTAETGLEMWLIEGEFGGDAGLEPPVISVVDVSDDAESIPVTATWSADSTGSFTYSWDLNHDGVFGDAEGRAPNLTWQDFAKLDPLPLKDRHNPISVRAVDDSGNAVTATGMMRISNTAPTIHLVESVAESKTGEPVAVTIDASDSVGDPLTFEVDFGDGTVIETHETVVSHAYDRIGIFTIRVRANDPHGGSATREHVVRVDQAEAQLSWHFEPGSAFGGDELTADIDLADFDADGRLDQVVVTVDGKINQSWPLDHGSVNSDPQEIGHPSWLLTLESKAAVVAKTGPAKVFVGNDGSLENESSWFLHMRFGRERVDVAAADLNGDGKTDLFIANRQEGDATAAPDSVVLQLPNESITEAWSGSRFELPHRELPSYYSESVELGDLNGDGSMDAITSGIEPSVAHIWFNDGEAHFTESDQRLSISGEHISIGDLNNDGFLDLFAATNEANQVWLNDGNGTFVDSHQRLGESPSSHVALGDLDADGDLDAFVTNRAGHASKLWLNDGLGGFVDSRARIAPQLESERVALGDVDFDGDLDVVVANVRASNHIYLNNFAKADPAPPALIDIGIDPNDVNVSVKFEFSKPVVINALSIGGSTIPRSELVWNETRTVYSLTMEDVTPRAFSLEVQDGVGQALEGYVPDKIFEQFAGDLNEDFRVSTEDFEILAAHFGREASSRQGDINDNGIVDFEDFLILAANYLDS